MSSKTDRLSEYIVAYGLLVDEIAEAVSCLPEDCNASKILESAVKDGFESLYPSEKISKENEE
jgi:hypothetical protein